jgi:hypothetical protein
MAPASPAVGYAAMAVAGVCFGSNYVPVKNTKTGEQAPW